MALCPEFEALLPLERSNYIGKIVHAVMNNTQLYFVGQELIAMAEQEGLFEGVTINPTPNDDKTEDNAH